MKVSDKFLVALFSVVNQHCFDVDPVLDPDLHVDTNPHAADPTIHLQMLKNKKTSLLLFTAVLRSKDVMISNILEMKFSGKK